MLSFSPLLDLEECSFTARHDECANIKATLCKFFFFFSLSLFSGVIWHHRSYTLHCRVTFGQLCRCSCDDYTDQNPASLQLTMPDTKQVQQQQKKDNASQQVYIFFTVPTPKNGQLWCLSCKPFYFHQATAKH